MRAGGIYVKLPIDSIDFERISENLDELKDSIRSYGMLQPVGVAMRGSRYKLIFGKRRIQACAELGIKYINTIQLTVREDEERLFSAIENIHRRENDINYFVEAVLNCGGGDAGESLCLNAPQIEMIRYFLLLSPEARKCVNKLNEQFIVEAFGDSAYFLRMCKMLEQIPDNAREKVRLSVMSDKRIFINEIEKIVSLMRTGGYNDSVIEDDDKIIITKKQGA